MDDHHRTRIVILGAGFAGTAAAQALCKHLPAHEASITLVDQHNYFLFTPMLTEAAAGEVDTRHIVNPIRQLSRRIHFEQGRVEKLELGNAPVARVTICLDGPAAPEPKVLEADHLVLALGSVPNFHHITGLSEHALTMKDLRDAEVLRNQVAALLERADVEVDAEIRCQLLTFVIGGGGFSGVETIAALNDYVRSCVRYYPSISKKDVRMVLIEPEKRLLPELSAGLADYTRRKLQQRGVEIRLGVSVAAAGVDFVELKGGERIPARTLIWTAGVSPSPVVQSLPCRKGHHGGVVVDATCRVPEYPGIWAVGDCAEVPMGAGAQPGSPHTYGPTAQNASREGTRVARNIVAVLHGQTPQPFTYRPIGELAMLGHHTGVASLFGMSFSGILAWFMWRAVYLAKLPRVSKKVRVGIDWTLDMLFGRDISALPTSSSQRSLALKPSAPDPSSS